ncbi:Peptidyl-prolyl cis-trans isomerase A [Durusdinium trenchii]|uniref:Peptidyl-prolyl cis-trans isomerase A n=1 Tax=Durusdinium trenchii TaxID=1381693 RepID=A0ABP0PZN5_9DINO
MAKLFEEVVGSAPLATADIIIHFSPPGGDHPPALLATPPVAWAPQGLFWGRQMTCLRSWSILALLTISRADEALRDVKRHVVVETNGIVRRSSWAQPPSLKVKCHTTKGLLHLQLDPSKSPAGVRRFVDLVPWMALRRENGGVDTVVSDAVKMCFQQLNMDDSLKTWMDESEP